MLIPPYEQFLNRYTIATPASGFAGHYVNLVAPASAVGEVRVDGNAVPASSFVAIGDSGFSGAQVPIATGSHTLTGPTQLGAFVYGFGAYDSYGYPAGLSLRRLPPISTLFGMRRSAGWANDPVNTGTGNFVTDATDLQYESIWGMDFGRTYNALDDIADSALGRGWSLSVQKWVTEDVDGTVWLHEPDGRDAAFRPEGSGYTRPEELFGSMRRDDDKSLSIAYFDGSVDDFGPEGRLTERRNWDGQAVAFAYDAAGNVKSMVHSSGKSLALAYDPPTRLASATTDDGRKVAFTYDAEGDLASVTDAAGGVTRYDTDARGLITRIVDPADRLVVANTYDGVRRVATQKFPAGGTAQFSYNIASRVTTVTDGSTGEVTRYAHDQEARLLAVTDATGATLTKSYDDAGNLVSVTDRRDASLHTRYDSHGNVVGTTDPLGARTSWAYDDADRLVSETDADGKTTAYAYAGTSRVPTTVTDANSAITTTEVAGGLVSSLTDADGVKTSYGYDAARNLVSVTDPIGGIGRLGYDGAGRPTSVTAPSGATARASYDALGRPLSETDAAGATTSYSYDPSGMLVSDTDPTGAKNVYVYDSGGNLVEARDGKGAATTYTYNANGEVLSVTEPGGATTRYEYGALGRLESVTDPSGAVTRFGYDADGNLVATTEADGAASKTAYDLKGRVLSETDPLGNVTRLAYDALDRLVSEADPTGAKTSYSYDAVGRLASVTDPRGAVASRAYTPAGRLASETDTVGAVTRHAYDKAGRLSTITDPLGGVTALTYDADGEVISSRSPAGFLTSLGYDAVGRITKITEPGGGVTTRTLTPRGELATSTDPTGAKRTFAYDAVGNLTEAVDANGGRTTYSYDARYNRVSRTNAMGGTDKWAYDLADRLVGSTDPLNRTTAYEYDGLGRLVRSADPSGRSQTLTYDAASQVIARTFADGSRVTYAYDAVGRRTQMVDAEGTTGYAYDIVGNLTEVVRPGGERVAYSYDVADRRTSVTYPNGSVATSTYDANGRQASVAHATLGTATQSWDADGRLVGEALPGGASRSFGYDAAGRLASFKQSLPGADRTTTLARDPAGRIISETTGSDKTSYSYDKAGQLLGATGGGFTGTYAYDALGRRTSSSSNGVNSSYAYDAASQLLSQTVNGSTGNYSHDEAGRRTSAKDSAMAVSYRYGSQGELSRVESILGTETTVEERNYDGDGGLRSIARSEPTGTKGTSKLTWDAGVVVPEILTMSSGTATTDLVYGIHRIGAVAGTAAPALFAIDAHGSTIPTAATSAFAMAGRYDPYGNPMDTASCGKRPVHPLDPSHCAGDAKGGNPPNVGQGKGPAANPKAAAAPKNDEGKSNTGGNVTVVAQSTTGSPTLGFGYRGELHVNSLVHLRARDYEPSTGVFTTVDPLAGVTGEVTVANPYPYAANDPLNQIDPLGLTPLRDNDMRLNSSMRNSLQMKGARIMADDRSGAFAAANKVVPRKAREADAASAARAKAFADAKIWCPKGPCYVYIIAGRTLYAPKGDSSGFEEFVGITDAQNCLDGNVSGCIWTGVNFIPYAGKAVKPIATGIKKGKPRGGKNAAGAVCSFSAGTGVLMADGTTKPIVDVREGDVALATDPETGETGPREVVATLPHIDQLLTLRTSAGEIVTTEDHRYWNVTDEEWQEAQKLDGGDRLLTADGNKVTVEGLDWTTVHIAAAYDLTVEEHHTFYVAAGDHAVLVHNCGPNGVFEASSKHHPNVGSRVGVSPTNGQAALDASVQVKSTSPRRVAYESDSGEFVVLDRTTDGVFHGHVRAWDQLTQEMQTALVKAGAVNRKGKPV